MPRSPGGDYTLPEGQPVEPNTVIESDVHNSLANDLASEMTDSLSRTGKGGMLAPFRTLDGTPAYPGFAFTSANNAGMSYEPSSRLLQLSTEGTLTFIVKSTGSETVGKHLATTLHASSKDVATPTSVSHALTAGDLTDQCVKIGLDGIQSVALELPATLNLNPSGGEVLINGKPVSDPCFVKSEFITISAGGVDAGKPIVLNGSGKVDSTMLSVSAFIYIGSWTPAGGAEYPDTTGLEVGSFWTVDGLSADYTFTGGDLSGQTATNDSVMILADAGWVMTESTLEPDKYYRLDGSYPLTQDFSGGGFKLSNIADGVADTDAATVGQLGSGSFLPIDGKAVDADKLDGMDSTEFAPVVHNHDGLYYNESEFIDFSNGVADAGKPIKLDSSGLVHATMIDVATFIYQGSFTPAAGAEYPSSVDLDPGAFWTIDGLSSDYTFTGGDLAGEIITNDDLLIWGTQGWTMTHSDNDLSVYYRLDGSRPLTGGMNAASFEIAFLGESSTPTSAATVNQATTLSLQVNGGNQMDAAIEINNPLDDDTVKFIRSSNGTTKGLVGSTDGTESVKLELFDSGGVVSAASITLTPDGNARLDNFSTPTDDDHIVTKKWVEDNAGGGAFVPIDGSEHMTGALEIYAPSGNAVRLMGNTTTKKFEVSATPTGTTAMLRLFDSLGNAENTMLFKENGNVELANFSAVAAVPDDIATVGYVEDNAGDFRADGSVAMTNDFDAGNNRLTNLQDGVASDDAATVGQLGSAGGSPIIKALHYDAKTQSVKFASGISSVIYGEQGSYTANFSPDFPNQYYYVVGSAGGTAVPDFDTFYIGTTWGSAGSCPFGSRQVRNDDTIGADSPMLQVVFTHFG